MTLVGRSVAARAEPVALGDGVERCRQAPGVVRLGARVAQEEPVAVDPRGQAALSARLAAVAHRLLRQRLLRPLLLSCGQQAAPVVQRALHISREGVLSVAANHAQLPAVRRRGWPRRHRRRRRRRRRRGRYARSQLIGARPVVTTRPVGARCRRLSRLPSRRSRSGCGQQLSSRRREGGALVAKALARGSDVDVVSHALGMKAPPLRMGIWVRVWVWVKVRVRVWVKVRVRVRVRARGEGAGVGEGER